MSVRDRYRGDRAGKHFGTALRGYASLDGIASQIIHDDNTSSELLEAAIPLVTSLQESVYCWPKAMHSAAIIRGRLVQVALENSDPDQFARSMAAANAMIRKSLSWAPADLFLWFALFWLENMQFGFRDESIRYLEQSYELGPSEGWIALKRNGYARLRTRPCRNDCRSTWCRNMPGL